MVGNVKTTTCNIESTLNGGIGDKHSSSTLYNITRSKKRRLKPSTTMSTTTISTTTPTTATSTSNKTTTTTSHRITTKKKCTTNSLDHISTLDNQTNIPIEDTFKIGDNIDVKMVQSKIWHPSKIIAINNDENKIKIHYYDLNSKFDEWLSTKSTRIKRINCDSLNSNDNTNINSDNINDDKSKNNDINQCSNHNNTLMNDKQSKNQYTNKLLSSKKLIKTKQSATTAVGGGTRASFVTTITESITPSDISSINMELSNTNSSNIVNDSVTINNGQYMDITSTNSDNHKSQLKDIDTIEYYKNQCNISDDNKVKLINNNVVSTTANICDNVKSVDSLNRLDTPKIKTYHTRNINRRYSLDTIVVDDSFNKSGVLTYQGSYIKNTKKKPPTIQSTYYTTSIGANKNDTLNKSNNMVIGKKKSRKSIPTTSLQPPPIKLLTNRKTTSKLSSISNRPNIDKNSNTSYAKNSTDNNTNFDIHSISTNISDSNIDMNIINRDILTTSDDNRYNVDTQNINDNIVNQKESTLPTLNESNLHTSFNDGVVKCLCISKEDDGIMIQCEHCLTWQHGHCLGYISHDQIPSDYICPLCCNPYFERSSVPISYQTLLSKGYFSNTILNQKCNLTHEISHTIAATFKLKDYITKLKSQICNFNIDIDVNEHIDELFDLYTKLELKSNKLFNSNTLQLGQCYSDTTNT